MKNGNKYLFISQFYLIFGKVFVQDNFTTNSMFMFQKSIHPEIANKYKTKPNVYQSVPNSKLQITNRETKKNPFSY